MSIATDRKAMDEAVGKTVPWESSSRARMAAEAVKAALVRNPAWTKRLVLALVLATAGILTVVAVRTLASGVNTSTGSLVFYTVQRGDLPITVTERGNLESQDNVEIICEVDDVHGDGFDGTAILSIVPNGSSVKKGELLVELDVTLHRDRLDSQVLDTERARAEFIQADAKFENQKTQNITAKADAELAVALAELELEMFEDTENGSHILEVEEINRQIDDVKNEILEAQANMELKKNEKRGIEALFKLGYAGKSELDKSRLDFLQAESQLASRLNRLVTHQATLAKKETFEREMQKLQLEGALETAKRNLTQVERNNSAELAQAEAELKAAQESLKKEEERLARAKYQIEKSKIYAPQDGMVAYATSSSRRYSVEICEGARVRLQQKILTLPNLTKMQVKTAVHESVLDRIEQGLDATVRVDAFPERAYQASVKSVAVLPDQGGWMSSDTKVYETYVTIDEQVSRLKPGMTAVVEIHVDRLEDILSIPVQSVVQVGGDSWCYVEHGGGVERRLLELGMTNDKFVEIHSGLEEGDRVVLNPSAVMDEGSRRSAAGISPEGSEANSLEGLEEA
jgi:RND family efflux transporter MFP subunit